jgi:alpha-tubulin suppressor-like RCC1 family protein
MAWGRGGAAALGLDQCRHGLQSDVIAPSAMLVSLFPGLTIQLTAGDGHSLVLHDDGTVSSFGHNNNGQ